MAILKNNEMSDHDLAVLADWANTEYESVPNESWKKAYKLIAEGADMLLRRRARSTVVGCEAYEGDALKSVNTTVA